ncbi:hypothetical protein N9893_02970 [bacterium]|nr:hypothetical protein [bacterium]
MDNDEKPFLIKKRGGGYTIMVPKSYTMEQKQFIKDLMQEPTLEQIQKNIKYLTITKKP